MTFSPDGRHALSASMDKTLRLWDVQSGKEMRQFVGHTDFIHNASFSPDGRRIFSASKDGTVRLWEVGTGAEIRSFEKRWAAVGGIAFSPDGRRALSNCDDGLRLWDVGTGEEVRRITDAAGFGTPVFTPDEHHAVSICDPRGKWSLWDLDTGKEVRSYYVEPPFRPKNDIGVSPDGRLAVCGNFRGSISIWRLGDPAPLGQELAAARQYYDQKCRDRGPDAPETLQARDELAALHLDRDEPADTEPLFRQSLESKKRLLGAEHPATLASMKNLAHLLQAQKNLAEAEAVCRQCLEIYRRVQGPGHPDVMVAMNDLADALEAQGKRDEADFLCRQCLEGWYCLLGSGHPETHAARRKLVSRLQAHGKPVNPEPLGPAVGYVYAEMGQWDKALAGYTTAFKGELPKDPNLWLEYACLLVQLGDIEGYHKLCAGLLEAFGHSKNEGELHLLASTCVLAPQARADAGRIVELAKEQLAMARRRGPPYGWGWELHALALPYYRTGEYQKAAELVSEFLKARPEELWTVMYWLLMGMIEHRLGHAEKAQVWLDKADLWIKEETPKMGQPEDLSALPRPPWRDWLMLQLLRREAEALIRGKIADQPPQRKTNKRDTKTQKP